MNNINWAQRQQRHRLIRRWIPQGLRDWFNYLIGYAIRYRGEFPDWNAALNAAGGYDDEHLIERLANAARAVKEGSAAWDQDGVSSDDVPPNLPLFAALSRVALATRGELSVLDFGGALGSSYFQCKHFLSDVCRLDWRIVEQPRLVEIGQQEISRETLRFFPSIESALAPPRPDVVLLSSVLQYIENPWGILEQILVTDIPYLVIDRHPCSITHEMITVQVLPSNLYKGSYPSWLFDGPAMLKKLQEKYELLATWESGDPPIRGWQKGANFQGYFLRRKLIK